MLPQQKMFSHRSSFASKLRTYWTTHVCLRVCVCVCVCVYIYIYIYIYIYLLFSSCPVSWGCRIHRLHFCRGGKAPSTSVLDMTLNNLMVRFQWYWSFGECGAPLHCHRSQVHSGFRLVAPDRVLSMGQIELKC